MSSTNFRLRYRDCKLTEQLDYYSAVALLGFSLIVALIRALELRTEAAQVTVAAPIIGFTTTHIFALMTFINDYCKFPPSLGLVSSIGSIFFFKGENKRGEKEKAEKERLVPFGQV